MSIRSTLHENMRRVARFPFHCSKF